MQTHPKHLIKARVKTYVVLDVDEYSNKEDSHGGPGYYPREIVIAYQDKEIGFVDIPTEVAKLIRSVS